MQVGARIEELLYRFVAIPSHTGTAQECTMAQDMANWLSTLPYYQSNPEHFGLKPIAGDYCNRLVVWALLKGKGKKTVVLINHLDTVDTLDYDKLQDLAYAPHQLVKALQEVDLRSEVREDLTSNAWIFGRGAADMKAGAAIQLALLEAFSQQSDFDGNIVYLSVADEETLSAGMRTAVELLLQLKKQYGLEYQLLIDSETHIRTDPHCPVLYQGSIGKVMPLVYVRGVKAHIGNVFQGFNPVALLAEITRRIELNLDFSDQHAGELAPPPTWAYFRDGKVNYDVSIPETAMGYTSILTFNSSPKTILNKFVEVCQEAFAEALTRYQNNYQIYQTEAPNPTWQVNVKTYAEVVALAQQEGGKAFNKAQQKYLKIMQEEINTGKINMPAATFKVIEHTLGFINDKTPLVVVAFAPPYYPHVVNANMENLPPAVRQLEEIMAEFVQAEWQETLTVQQFYKGISDMSYAALQDANEVIPYLTPNMPLWGDIYSIPLETMAELAIPSVNIGPWGKDLHMFTERVHKQDLFEHTPRVMAHVIQAVLA